MRRIILIECDVERTSFRGSGPGGQHKNKTETCIRLRHRPTGLTAEGRSERSQSANYDFAWRLLQAKLDRLVEQRLLDQRQADYRDKPDAAFGQQIRTYRRCGAEQVVTDHRTGYQELTQAVLGRGRLDGMIRARLHQGRA